MDMYGSLTNRIMERHNTKPEIGMGVTEYLWSDSHAYEIVEVIDDRHIVIRALRAVMKPGTDWYDQDYNYFSDPSERLKKLFLTSKGVWRERIGRCLGDTKFGIGVAREYRDPSF